LGLFCDLLEEPGVLTPAYAHFGKELRLVAQASRQLVEKLVSLEERRAESGAPQNSVTEIRIASPATDTSILANPTVADLHANTADDSAARARESRKSSLARQKKHWEMTPSVPISDLATDLRANRNLLAALAGPSVQLTLTVAGSEAPVALTSEDLTRLLVNLVKNATEAMPTGGAIRIDLREQDESVLLLSISDSGPGIPEDRIDGIFAPGYTTHQDDSHSAGGWTAAHRGLGLTISRSIIEAAGGSIRVSNLSDGGACFTLEVPVRPL